MALAHADSVVQLQSDLQSDEQPEDWVWTVPEALNAHLNRIAEKRRKPRTPGDDDDETDWDDESKWTKSAIVPDDWR